MALTNTWLQRMMRNYLIRAQLKPNLKDTLSVGSGWYGYDNGSKDFPTRNMSTILLLGDTDGVYRGSAILNYTTLRLDFLFRNFQPVVHLYNPTSTMQVAKALIKKYGLGITEESFIDEPIDGKLLPVVIPLRCRATEWLEATTVNVRIERATVDLNDILTKSTTLESPKLPTTIETGRTPAEYSYSMDFTPDLPEIFYAIQNYPTEQFEVANKDTLMAMPIMTWLLAAIKDRMEIEADWEVTGADGYAFNKSILVYNGPVSAYAPAVLNPWTPRGDDVYDNLLVIQFSNEIPGRSGLGYFHYNTVGR